MQSKLSYHLKLTIRIVWVNEIIQFLDSGL